MTSRKAVVWLDGWWYDALSRQLKKKDTTVEDELNKYLDAIIGQLPEQAREKISREIWAEDWWREAAEAAQPISVFRAAQGGRTNHLRTQRPHDVSRAVGSAHTGPAKIVAFAEWIFQPGYGIVLPAPKNNERMNHT